MTKGSYWQCSSYNNSPPLHEYAEGANCCTRSDIAFHTTIGPFWRFSRLDSFGRRGVLLYEKQFPLETALRTTFRPFSLFVQEGRIVVRKLILPNVHIFAPSESVLYENSRNYVKRTTFRPSCIIDCTEFKNSEKIQVFEKKTSKLSQRKLTQ